jgi:hypothetical protein
MRMLPFPVVWPFFSNFCCNILDIGGGHSGNKKTPFRRALLAKFTVIHFPCLFLFFIL